MGKALCQAEKSKLVSFLQEHQDCFAWSPDDMLGILTRFAQHSLDIDKTTKPVKQKRRPQSLEHQTAIKEEVAKLLHKGVIREVRYPE